MEEWTAEGDFPRIVSDMLLWRPAGASEAFSYSLVELFRPAGGRPVVHRRSGCECASQVVTAARSSRVRSMNRSASPGVVVPIRS